jgi:flagellar motility protein MotE (MotC chaperone)
MANPFPRFRFLPLTIFAAALMLTFKMGSIWEGFDAVLTGTISVARVQAQQAPNQATKPQAPAQPSPGESAEAAKPKTPAKKKKPSAASLATDDPTLLTQAEIDLLQQLAERRELLDDRERELEQRSGLLEAAESRIDKKVSELKSLQASIEQLIKTHEKVANAKVASMVKIYENMKPKDAARIFEELDMETLLLVAERMNERKLAPVMAQMNPELAKEMTIELTRADQLPLPGSAGGG